MAAGVYILCMRLEVFSFILQVYQWSIKPQNWYQNSSMGKLAPELRQTHPFEFHFWCKSGLFILQWIRYDVSPSQAAPIISFG